MAQKRLERLDPRVETDYSDGNSLAQYLEHIPSAFAITTSDRHVLVYANAAFRNLATGDVAPLPGRPIADSFAKEDRAALSALLDRAFVTGVVSRNRRLGSVSENARPLSCTIWPDATRNGEGQHLLIELRPATEGELAIGLQREVAERLLLSAVREHDAAGVAEESRRGAAFVAAESRRLTESLDESATLVAMARMSLPSFGNWCIVDTLDDDDTMHRVAIIHPDPAKQARLRELEGRWSPQLDDEFGLPAALRSAGRSVATSGSHARLASAVHDPVVVGVLRDLGAGPLLTVPLVIRERLVGAVTFVGGRDGQPFTAEDISMAEDLASRSAVALDRARTYGHAVAQRVRAESASEAKSAFLGMMSHELRTPLNAIGGYVDLLDMEIHGPVTEAQHVDLARIRSNQRYLMGLISDLLSLTKVGSGQVIYNVGDVDVKEVLAASVALVEPLIARMQLQYESIECGDTIVARGDRERIIQILVNLLSNAIKFTPAGGRLTIECEATGNTALMHVCDTGIGIPADKLEAIFEPFIQVRGEPTGPEAGIGLGLSISRSLARAMHGELTVTSTLGEGSCFTLALPLAAAAPRTAAVPG